MAVFRIGIAHQGGNNAGALARLYLMLEIAEKLTPRLERRDLRLRRLLSGKAEPFRTDAHDPSAHHRR